MTNPCLSCDQWNEPTTLTPTPILHEDFDDVDDVDDVVAVVAVDHTKPYCCRCCWTVDAVDAGIDAGIDDGIDAGIDAGFDAGFVAVDAGFDAADHDAVDAADHDQTLMLALMLALMTGGRGDFKTLYYMNIFYFWVLY